MGGEDAESGGGGRQVIEDAWRATFPRSAPELRLDEDSSAVAARITAQLAAVPGLRAVTVWSEVPRYAMSSSIVLCRQFLLTYADCEYFQRFRARAASVDSGGLLGADAGQLALAEGERQTCKPCFWPHSWRPLLLLLLLLLLLPPAVGSIA